VSSPINEFQTCDDASNCTHSDKCTSGVCQGTPYDCSSLETPCREAGCDPETGACTATDLPDGNICDDGNACTFEGTCLSGFCQTVPLTCTSFGDICNYGMCDPELGECYAQPKPNGSGCSDNNPCTLTSSCQDGVCTGTEKDCSELDGPCQTGYCNTFNGFCALDVQEDGTSCDDGEACTGNDACIAGSCQGLFDLATPGCDHPCANPVTVDKNANIPGVQLPFLYADTTAGATDNTDTQGCGGLESVLGQGSPDVIFRFEVPSNGTYRFRLVDSTFDDTPLDAVLSLHQGGCPTMPSSFCESAVTSEAGAGSEAIERVLSEGSVLYLVVDGSTPGATGVYILRVEELPTTEVACGDNFDDEGDGLTDCEDPDCTDDFECLPVIPDDAIAFTELMTNPAPPLDVTLGDWIEVYNATEVDVALQHLWLAVRTWDPGESEPGLPTAAHMFDSGTLWAQQDLLLTRSAASADNGGITVAAVYGSIDLDRTRHMRLQLVRPGWDGTSNPEAAYIIDDLTLPAVADAASGRSWQLKSLASLAVDAAIQNDDPASWCQTPALAELEYATGQYGTPVGGGSNGGLLTGQNLPCP
jgi:hypothetical protein